MSYRGSLLRAAAALAFVARLAAPGTAHAGLEFCFTPECDDGDPCTCDIANDDGTCTHDPRARWAAAARASGIQVEADGQFVIPPTPDSNVKSPDDLVVIPADPLAHVEVLHVEEIQENRDDNTESYAFAKATTGKVRIFDQGGGNFLVSADAIQAVSESVATDETATSSTAGSTLANVVVNGVPLGDVSEPMDLSFRLPGANLRADVRLLQKLPVGGAAGEPVPDPQFGVVLSGVTVNGIRVTVRDESDPSAPRVIADVIVARADSRVDRFSPASCGTVNPRVSGAGFVFNLDLDETAVDPERQLHRTRVGEVVLPSTGGAERADLAHVGPIVDSSMRLLLESETAFSHTEGSVDDASGDARSTTVSAIERMEAFDVGEGAQMTADVVRSECSAKAGSSTLESEGRVTLFGARIGGRDVCAELGLEDGCTPPPNTELDTGIPGVRIVLNEQIADPESAQSTGITVNAIHVRAFGSGNELGIPAGADLIVSRAHCDAFSPKAASGPLPSPEGLADPGDPPSGPLGDLLSPSKLGAVLGPLGLSRPPS